MRNLRIEPSPRFRAQKLFLATVATVLLGPSAAYGSSMLPVFTVSGTAGRTVTNSASIKLNNGLLTVQYQVTAGQNAQTIATNLAAALNNAGLSTIPDYFTFAAPVQVNNSWVIQGSLAPGNTTVLGYGAKFQTGLGLNGARVYSAIDPLAGYADFDLTGTAVGGSLVSLGIDGVTVTTMTTPGESDATIMAILESELFGDGLPMGVTDINTATNDMFTENGIDTGNPLGGADFGAFLESDDPGLATEADVNVVTPEPSSWVLLATGMGLGLIGGRGLLQRRA